MVYSLHWQLLSWDHAPIPGSLQVINCCTPGKTTIIISDSGKFHDRNARQTIESVTAIKPNNALGGKRVLLPVGLWMYNYRNPAEKKESPGWFYRTLAKEPVLVSTVNPEVRCRKLESELFSKGYFHCRVWANIDTSNRNPRKAGISYFIDPDQPFRYHEISFVPPADAIDSIIYSFKDGFALKPDDIFDLEKIKSETKKISSGVLGKGYFYFNPTDVNWMADTTRMPYQIDLRIGKKPDLSYFVNRKYSIDDITIRINNPGNSLPLPLPADSVYYDGISLINSGDHIKPKVISRAIYFREGDWYSPVKQQQTMNHLNSYGIYKYLNMQFIPDPDSLLPQMDLSVDLTPMQNISLDLEANVVTKSTGFSGPGFAATLAHGNLARGANRLQLKLNGGFEWQWSGSSSSALGTMSYNFGLSSSIIFPKILKPFNLINTKRFNLPQTSVNLGFEFMNKIQYYQMSSFNMGLGYQWKRSAQITHIFYPLFFNSIRFNTDHNGIRFYSERQSVYTEKFRRAIHNRHEI